MAEVATNQSAVGNNMEGHLFQALTHGCDNEQQQEQNQDADTVSTMTEITTGRPRKEGLLKNHEAGKIQPPDTIITCRNRPLRRSSMTHTRAEDFTVADLYRCRTVTKLVSTSRLLKQAQARLWQETSTFEPNDFGLDVRRHHSSYNNSLISTETEANFYYGRHHDKMADVIGQSSNYFTVYSVECPTIAATQPTNSFKFGIPRPLEDDDGSTTLKEQAYVLKKVNHALLAPDVLKDKPKAVPQAAITLAVEAHFLASVSHPNIIALRGIAEPSLTPLSQMFFLVDRLEETLDARISNKWKTLFEKYERRTKSSLKNVFASTSQRKTKSQRHELDALQLQLERHVAARDLTSAVEHLHKHRILHRDMKPENVGFLMEPEESNEHYREHGRLQLFDFGIATELPPPRGSSNSAEDYNPKDETYLLTSRVGSIRYMAPEVYLGREYGTSADVYSLGVMLFQIFSLIMPYDDMTEGCMKTLVFERGMRPGMDVPQYLSNELRELIPLCYAQTQLYRPSARDIQKKLNALVGGLEEHIQAAIALSELEETESKRPERRLSLNSKRRFSLEKRGSIKDAIKGMSRRLTQERAHVSGKVTRRRHSMGTMEPPDEQNPPKEKRKSFTKIFQQHQLEQMALSIQQEEQQNEEQQNEEQVAGQSATEQSNAGSRKPRRNSATKYSAELAAIAALVAGDTPSDIAVAPDPKYATTSQSVLEEYEKTKSPMAKASKMFRRLSL